MTGKIAENVFAVGSAAGSFYVVTAGRTAICFDAGLSPAQARRGFRRLGLDPLAVSHVFLTHSDRDHVGGLPLFANAAVYMCEAERAVIDGTVPRTFLFLKRRNRFDRPFLPIRDGDTVAAGPFRVRAVGTPGHTPGSTSFLVDDAALFTGDLLTLRRGRARPSPRLISNDAAEGERSLFRLAAQVPYARWLCTGHSGCTSDYRAALAGYFPEQT